jgi:hypothetical protein
VVYFKVKFRDAQGILVNLGDRGVALEASAAEPAVGSAIANQ